jgi:4,5-dihydroxyphthalate decarboxylase
MADLRLSMAFDAPTLAPIGDGNVRFEGIDLQLERIGARERHQRFQEHLEWDICEFSLASILAAIDIGHGVPYSAVPSFPLRTFRHRDIWTSAAAGVSQPSDLNGKRIGVQNWDNSAAIWQRGALAEDFGLDLAGVDWVASIGTEAEGFEPPEWLKLTVAPRGQRLEAMLVAGELAAMMVPFPPQWPEGSEGKYRRLFPNFVEAEQEYYRRHRVFPVMHTVVIKRDVLDANPWVAQSVYDGLRRSIDAFVEGRRTEAGKSQVWPTLSWEEQERILGPNPWPSGLEANLASLNTAIDYSLRQGLIKTPIDPAELFLKDGEPVVELG